ncbi:MAG: superoxide dismutase [Candidatus Niyogibacteria bacterium RIFCSPLOWO2_01_FULL_45_48]|uniref:Superoxide dismutase n=2 Tax=Candidatus Niyogiibacteriota TaxID=1817912 RepID=A0A1G2F1H4_9BACT|nr:MAG: superoxide dismutase [Candidatus Niyogibacteria bacterium RIFCSPLOWO2_01_FULL_45_48]OGZ30328.1 MAG: superoxide dismutase [Candidatus Niyogibacteria bacterium RIFCSPHIGHO2_01_FULL_45_28]OGZ31612.1 MAG: superoxide dismutase [Candidatus Niyogibacteria bacterium RIFCSPLOWO2_02_FULL_45_13]
MKHELLKLPYDYSALEPYIDSRTMEIHHSKHHQAYVDKLNAALEAHLDLQEKSVEDLLKDLNSVPEDIRTAVRNHGGGHYNHSIFWTSMDSPTKVAVTGGSREPAGAIGDAIDKEFGRFSDFKEKFAAVAVGVFGSGWAWLVKDNLGKLIIISTPNQDSPVSQGLAPLLGIDVWEHAYYLKYQNRRAEYVENWWNVVNWEEVGRRFVV